MIIVQFLQIFKSYSRPRFFKTLWECLPPPPNSRRVVICLVVVYVRLFVPTFVRLFVPFLIQPRVFNIFWPNLKYRKKNIPRRFSAILYWVTDPWKFVINYYFKLGQLDIAGRLWLKYYIYNTAENMHCSQKTFK